jgi:hypothetical protein
LSASRSSTARLQPSRSTTRFVHQAGWDLASASASASPGSGSGGRRLSPSRAIVRSTPFTNPAAFARPPSRTSDTAVSTAAKSGTRSSSRREYAPIRSATATAGSIASKGRDAARAIA